MVTIGITGTIGAGKGTIVEFLVKEKNFKHYSVRSFLLEEIARRGLEPTRDSMALVADIFRKEHHPGFIMEQLYEQRKKYEGPAVIESQRAIGEIETLKKIADDFFLFAVDANPRVRYDRIVERNSSTDHITYEKFLADEESELHNVEPWKMNLVECIKRADFVFRNDGSVDELFKKVEDVLNEIL
jgi:dephospho-CoA kinase